jgi:hypothetical protein
VNQNLVFIAGTPTQGQSGNIILNNCAGLTFNTNITIKWPNGNVPVFDNGIHVISYYCYDETTILMSSAHNFG